MKKKIFPYELIGEEVEVISARNKHDLGILGKVVDETKTTITIDQKGCKKMLIKKNIVLRLVRNRQEVPGSHLHRRPEERIK